MDHYKPKDAPASSQEVRASALFVDLDQTTLEGTATRMTDDEIRNDKLIETTISLINRARSIGVPVVMVSRNTRMAIDRVLDIRPDIAMLFDEILPCESTKSGLINGYLKSKDIDPENGVFIDDNDSELTDVEKNSCGVSAVNTIMGGKIQLGRMKKSHYGSELAYADNIALAA